jgi:hypothetical protein
VTGFGMGMIYASLSVLTLSLSAPHEQVPTPRRCS